MHMSRLGMSLSDVSPESSITSSRTMPAADANGKHEVVGVRATICHRCANWHHKVRKKLRVTYLDVHRREALRQRMPSVGRVKGYKVVDWWRHLMNPDPPKGTFI